jgi:segregation and condensation protein B
MSLKAKIEAVIYASEEPVTLAQLAGLLGHEAQAELDHLDSAQHALALEEAVADEDELNSEVLADSPEIESQVDAEHAEALKRHLHDAAAEEAAHARAVRLRTAAATAAMSSADSVEPFLAIFEGAPPSSEQGSEAPAEVQPEEKDEKKIAREAKEKDRRLRD